MIYYLVDSVDVYDYTACIKLSVRSCMSNAITFMFTLFFFSDLRLICEGLPFKGAPGVIIEADICKYDSERISRQRAVLSEVHAQD
jgi:hypothetical protein